MTDITELAQREQLKEKFEVWFEREYRHLESSKYTDAVPHIKYGFLMAYQAGGSELVEALEKAQRANAAQDDHINQQQDRIEALEKKNAELGKYAGKLETINAAAEKLFRCKGRYHSELNYRALAALFGVNTPDLPPLDGESRTVKLPPELYTIGELIRTQDNRITDQPMFVVFQKREIIGSDEHSPSRICWVWDGEEVSELRAKRLEALYQDGRDTRGYDRYAMQEVDEFVTACFTEHGCKDYLRQNAHNLRLPYIYACGSFRNNEYQLVRNWLAGIKVEAE
ncbi:Ead domain protein [Klebsiella pneumoniae]|nr:Ead domain protein [Klebsiella pneumoniae]